MLPPVQQLLLLWADVHAVRHGVHPCHCSDECVRMVGDGMLGALKGSPREWYCDHEFFL